MILYRSQDKGKKNSLFRDYRAKMNIIFHGFEELFEEPQTSFFIHKRPLMNTMFRFGDNMQKETWHISPD